MNHKYSTYALIGIGILFIIVFFVLALDSSDLDDICSQNNMSLIRINDVWTCGNIVNSTTIYINNTNTIYINDTNTIYINETANLSDYVPYVNATQNIDLGLRNLKTNGTIRAGYSVFSDAINGIYVYLASDSGAFILANAISGKTVYLAETYRTFFDGTVAVWNDGHITTSGNITASKFISSDCGGGFEKGDFKMSNNSINSNCWKVANGSSGTSDLRDKFIVGGGLTYPALSSGGSLVSDNGYASVHDSGHTHTIIIDDYTGYTQVQELLTVSTNVPLVPHTHTASSQTAYTDIYDNGHSHTSIPPYYALIYKECVC